MSRLIPLDGIENLRDFGDYPVSGGRIAKGRLFRSAHHAGASDADLAVLEGLGLSTIVDLRRPAERSREPSRRWTGFAAAVIDNQIDEAEGDTWLAFLRGSDLSLASFRAYMDGWYERAPFEPRHIDLFTRGLAAAGRGEGAVLVHCAAGKDRTGLLCGLIQHVAGAHRDDILADYLLTNDASRIEGRLEAMADHVQSLNGGRPEPDALRIAMGVEARLFETSLTAIAARYGDLDAYIEQALGLDALDRERIAAALVV